MSDAIRDQVSVHLESALSQPIDLNSLSDDSPLNSLGLDSLLVIGALVGLAEESGVDLAEYIDKVEAPQTIGDLVRIAELFRRDGVGA